MKGSAMAVKWADQNPNAILAAYDPSEEGGTAIAESLAGENYPAGRLPVTFYKSVDDLPPFEDYSMQSRSCRYFRGKPLYAFDHGLNYSQFDYAGLKLSAATLRVGASPEVDVEVRSTGQVARDEVVHLHLGFP
jgi:beta-glucosidase